MKKLIFIFPVVAFAISGCTHYYYMPNQHNVPMFREKNEVRVSGAYTTGDAAKGFEVQGGYSVTKNLAVLGTICVINPNKNADGSGQLYELGAGYYKPFSKYFVFENYGFAGIGHSKGVFHNDSFPSDVAYTNFLKVYDQPSIGFSYDIFDIILSEKIGVLNFFKMKPGATPVNNSSLNDDVNIVTGNRTSFFIEPAATLRIGYKWVKLNAQVGYTFLSNSVRERSGRWDFNIGVLVSFAPRFKKK